MPRGKAKDADKPRGKMSAYAYFLQICREDHKKKHPNDQVNFAEFSKKCAEKWKGMNEKEKKRFHDLASQDKARFDKEMASYVPPPGSGKRKRGKKDPNAPKRALSAFFWFCNDDRPKVRAQQPNAGVGDIAKELGQRWSKVPADLKAKYEQMAAKDKERYIKEVQVYKSGGGGGSSKKRSVAKSAPQASEEDDDSEEEEDDE